MKKVYQSICLISLLASVCDISVAAEMKNEPLTVMVSPQIPPSSLINEIKEEISNVQYSLPIDLGNGMKLCKIAYKDDTHTAVYRYEFTVYGVTKPTAEVVKERKLAVIHLLKSQPNSNDMRYLKAGITFHYNYYDINGTFLYAIKITPKDIR